MLTTGLGSSLSDRATTTPLRGLSPLASRTVTTRCRCRWSWAWRFSTAMDDSLGLKTSRLKDSSPRTWNISCPMVGMTCLLSPSAPLANVTGLAQTRASEDWTGWRAARISLLCAKTLSMARSLMLIRPRVLTSQWNLSCTRPLISSLAVRRINGYQSAVIAGTSSVSVSGISARPRNRQVLITSDDSGCRIWFEGRDPPRSQSSTTSSLATHTSLNTSCSSHMGSSDCQTTEVCFERSASSAGGMASRTLTLANECVVRCVPDRF
mmetsp:Transcript_15661/g.44670  ORF Transcript_15661/g.44670 Transcript_15661/m.44670 type:complete len:266 (-) Transcript_15661:13135-13932(-)